MEDLHVRLDPKTAALVRKDAKVNKRSVSQQVAFVVESAYSKAQLVIDAAKMPEFASDSIHGAIRMEKREVEERWNH
jgi:uncharacterized protein (DUF1778 family)